MNDVGSFVPVTSARTHSPPPHPSGSINYMAAELPYLLVYFDYKNAIHGWRVGHCAICGNIQLALGRHLIT